MIGQRWLRRFPFLFSVMAFSLPLGAQDGSSGALVVRLGTDTLSVEQWTRTASRMEGDYVRQAPAASQWHYVVSLGPTGLPRELELTPVRAANPLAFNGVRKMTVRWDVDSLTIETLRDTVIRRRRAAHNSMPIFPDSYAFFELWMSWLRQSGQDSAIVTMFAPLGGPSGPLLVRQRGDSAQAIVFGSPMRIRTDVQGRLHGLDARASTLKHVAERVTSIDLDRVFASFARRDSVQGASGAFISPRDTVEAVVGTAHFWVDYGRPVKRGRTVFANGVLGDTLWRTGANAATQFRTDRDLQFEGRTLPAGTYTIWTHISETGAELIFNAQIGQWGTQYDRSRDVMRVPLEARRAEGGVVELFTISIIPVDGERAGALLFSWDDAEWYLRFVVR